MRSVAFIILMLSALVESPTWADDDSVIRVSTEPGALIAALAVARPGDHIVLAAGVHQGPITINTEVTLSGEDGAIIDAGGEGSVISVMVPGVTVKGLTVVGSGIDHSAKDSGIFLDREAHGARIEGNVIRGNLVGVYIWGARNSIVRDNEIIGRQDLRMNERGNGVYVWNAPGAAVIGNDIQFGRDGIFVNTSSDNRFEYNTLSDLRYGIHYMYTNNSVVRGNLSERNDAGFALMFSEHLVVEHNISQNDASRGLLLNYLNSSIIRENKIIRGGDKCAFVYNSNKNDFDGNWFEGCPIGIHFTGGSERNTIHGNAFIANQTQVMYVGTRWVDWTYEGVGNFWSDFAAFDMDGDGLADTPYKPNDMMDHIMWQFPGAQILTASPAVQLLKWAQDQFPGLLPGGVIDKHPLMQPRELIAIREIGRQGS